MATRKPKAATADDVIDGEELIRLLDDDSFTGDSLNPALESIYAEMGMSDGGEATVHVTKLDANGRGAEARVWNGSPDDYDLERIAKTFGTGDYRVKVYVRIPTGQKALKGNKVFAWMLSPEDEAKRVAPQQIQGMQPINMQAEMARIAADTLKGLLPQLLQAMTPQTQPVDPFDQMQKLATLMRTLRPEQTHIAPPPDPFGQMKSVIELTNMLKGDAEPLERGVNANGNDLLLGLITKFGPLLAAAMQQQAGQPQQMPGQPPQLQSPMPMQPVAPQSQTAPLPGENEVSFKIKAGLAFLIGQCEAGGQPETYAEVVLDSIPPEDIDKLLADPAPLDIFAKFDPRVKQAPYDAWFLKMIEVCKELLKPDDEAPPTEVSQ